MRLRLLARDRIGLHHEHGIVAHLVSLFWRQGEEVENQLKRDL